MDVRELDCLLESMVGRVVAHSLHLSASLPIMPAHPTIHDTYAEQLSLQPRGRRAAWHSSSDATLPSAIFDEVRWRQDWWTGGDVDWRSQPAHSQAGGGERNGTRQQVRGIHGAAYSSSTSRPRCISFLLLTLSTSSVSWSKACLQILGRYLSINQSFAVHWVTLAARNRGSG